MTVQLLGMNDPVDGVQYPPMTTKILNLLKQYPPLLKFKHHAMAQLAEELYRLSQQDPPVLPIAVSCWTARDVCETLSEQYGVVVWGLLNNVPVTIVETFIDT